MFDPKDLFGSNEDKEEKLRQLGYCAEDAKEVQIMLNSKGWQIYKTYLEQALDIFDDTQFSTESLLKLKFRLIPMLWRIVMLQCVKNTYKKCINVTDEIIRNGRRAVEELKIMQKGDK